MCNGRSSPGNSTDPRGNSGIRSTSPTRGSGVGALAGWLTHVSLWAIAQTRLGGVGRVIELIGLQVRPSRLRGMTASVIRRIDLRGADLSAIDLATVLPRAGLDVEAALEAVKPIVEDVRVRGDEALLDLGERLDGVRPPALRVPAEALT